MVRAVAVFGFPDNAFDRHARLPQGGLFRWIVGCRVGLDAMCIGRLEQVVGELALGFGSEASTPELGEERDPKRRASTAE